MIKMQNMQVVVDPLQAWNCLGKQRANVLRVVKHSTLEVEVAMVDY